MILKVTRHWVSITVLILGVMWMCLLLWTNNTSEKQHANYVLSATIADIQIHTSAFHLWLEEFLAGDPAIDINKVWKDHAAALLIIDAVLNGGVTEHGPILEPLTNTNLRSRLIDIRSNLMHLREMAAQRINHPKTAAIGSEIDHRFDTVFVKILTETAGVVDVINVNSVSDKLKSQRLFLIIGAVWTVILAMAVLGLKNREIRRSMAEKSLLLANEQLQNQTVELMEHREQLGELVKRKTEELTSVNESLQLEIGEKNQKEGALKESTERLRYLSNELLAAQDNERKRISGELHDELGQSLTLLKLNLRSVKKKLREDQGSIREECDNILQYINGVIENVRRLATDLSPCILEDIGLTGALRQLINNCVFGSDLAVTVDIMEIDRLVSPKAATHLYRILQEALNNTIKHSGANTVSIAIRSDGTRVSFLFEDDGVGFDANNINSEKGLGLAIMKERVHMLGGSLELSSASGNGTRIAFAVPIETGAIAI
jgi:signal transduction histidine kinase